MVTQAEILERLTRAFTLTEVPGRGAAPAELWNVDGGPRPSASSRRSPLRSAARATGCGSPPTASCARACSRRRRPTSASSCAATPPPGRRGHRRRTRRRRCGSARQPRRGRRRSGRRRRRPRRRVPALPGGQEGRARHRRPGVPPARPPDERDRRLSRSPRAARQPPANGGRTSSVTPAATGRRLDRATPSASSAHRPSTAGQRRGARRPSRRGPARPSPAGSCSVSTPGGLRGGGEVADRDHSHSVGPRPRPRASTRRRTSTGSRARGGEAGDEHASPGRPDAPPGARRRWTTSRMPVDVDERPVDAERGRELVDPLGQVGARGAAGVVGHGSILSPSARRRGDRRRARCRRRRPRPSGSGDVDQRQAGDQRAHRRPRATVAEPRERRVAGPSRR